MMKVIQTIVGVKSTKQIEIPYYTGPDQLAAAAAALTAMQSPTNDLYKILEVRIVL